MSSMAVWETEDEYGASDIATENPTSPETPYRTPSRTSRRSRRSVTPPGKMSSPPPIPGAEKSDKSAKRSSKDVATDDTLSVLDPRRFTPTLHANLVSEILSLRRDQEEKIKIIESLETSLHSTREEQESLQTTLTSTSKESRSLKRQLALLEGGTSSALGELARERDDAVDTATETRKRLDAAQKKLRAQEDDSQRVHDQWAKEKDEWEEEKRKFERKVHVAESRLKMLLDEVAAFQAAQANGFRHAAESDTEETGRENDGASVRSMSMTNSVRFSVMTIGKPAGHSLADELNFDETDYETDPGGRESVLSNHAANFHMRNTSRDSAFSKTHRRNPSNDSLIRSGSVARGRFMNPAVLERLEDGIIKEADEEVLSPAPALKTSYADSAVQYSPPPSPILVSSKPSTPEPQAKTDRSQDVETSPRGEWEVEANQRRKRVYVARPLTIEPVTATKLMVSSAAQTAEVPLSFPKTPKAPPIPDSPVSARKSVNTTMVSSSTQTEIPPPLEKPVLLPPPEPLCIPSISIHPPTSRPTTPREPRLPQLTKDFACQVNFSASVPCHSIAVQTEEIRIDQRLDRLPAHLHPSAITSRPASPAAPEIVLDDSTRTIASVPTSLPPRNPRRLTTKRSLTNIPSSPMTNAGIEETHDSYPGNNDDGPLSNQKAPMRRPPRISSLFAGFDGGSSDEVDEFADADMSDSEYRTALSAPRPKSGSARVSKRNSGGVAAMSSPEQQPVLPRQGSGRASARPLGSIETYSKHVLSDGREARESMIGRSTSSKGLSRSFEKPSAIGSSNKSSVMRKAAMIQNGIAIHSRARSPSLTDPRDPPFPIPTRASSRKPPVSVSAPSDGQRSPTYGEVWHRRGAVGRSHSRANSIRKVRSATNLPRNQRSRRQGSRSPPPFSELEEPESPGLPPLPNNDITTPRHTGTRYKSHQQQPSTNTNTTGFESQNSSNQATGVVDAIAQTMVGEWMHKYVRRRKSFGVADGAGKDDSSNDRHKRWVWLAPYERAILWSSKQPSSNSTLMGKSGRKLTIQSVLDVKDDNPPPKGVPQLFNRSILILTPQRALKFTAVNAERHYIWLTSLSFLAHSQQAVPDIVAQMNPPKQLPEFETRPKMRKGGIRDSIRLAKGKTNVPRGPVSVASLQADSMPPSLPSYPPSLPSYPPSLPSYPPSLPSHRPPESVVSVPYSGPYSVPSVAPSVSAPSTHTRDLSRDTAEPPAIARFHDRSANQTIHGRKRSNTGGHVPPPLSFRGFSSPLGGASSYHHASTNSTAGNSDMSQSQSSSTHTNNMTWAMSTTGGSQRTSEASSRPSGAVMNNFFDAIGTVRMEAFISPLAFSRFEGGDPDEQEEMRYRARRRSKEQRRRASRSRHRDSYQSRGTKGTDDYYSGSRTAGEEDYFFRDDPFKGF